MTTPFQLFLCNADPELVVTAANAGVDGVVVEWETSLFGLSSKSNHLSEGGVDPARIEALRQVRDCTEQWVICRLNSYGAQSQAEVKTALDTGADEIWLPKVNSVREVESVLSQVNDRCEVGIVIETQAALKVANDLSALPLAHIHVGINDLAEALGNPHPLCTLADGTIEQILRQLGRVIPYGFLSVTVPERQQPLPGRLLIGELVRLGCRFGLLRSSFLDDTKGQDLSEAIARIRAALQLAATRTEAETDQDKQAIYSLISSLLATETSSS